MNVYIPLCIYLCSVFSLCMHVCVCVTIVGDDSPGSEGSVQASQHPEHAEPAQMFSTFIHLQELSVVGVDYWDGTPNPGGRRIINHKYTFCAFSSLTLISSPNAFLLFIVFVQRRSCDL